MGFNNYGLFFIWNSQKMRVEFGDGNDYGAHWIMADPLEHGRLTVGEFTKVRYADLGGISLDTLVSSPPSNRTFVYYEATVSNDAGFAQWFTLQGGGNT